MMSKHTTFNAPGPIRILTFFTVLLFLLYAMLIAWPSRGGGTVRAQDAQRIAKQPRKSSFYDLINSVFSPGIGQISDVSCMVGVGTQPAIYAGNMLLDCDAETPHNETTIAVDPGNPTHAVGGYHSLQYNFLGNTAILHVIGTSSVTFDGGQHWQQVVPPIAPYDFSGDPALTFTHSGRIYFSNLVAQRTPSGNQTSPSIGVAHSDDGGLTWSNPVTVVRGKGALGAQTAGQVIFNDKDFITADPFPASPFTNRVYVTWTSFEQFSAGPSLFQTSPIKTAFSDDGVNWSEPRAISGFSPHCSVPLFGAPNECNFNQSSYPTVAPKGKVYVSFENFNTPAENQILVVSSADGGNTWSAPAKAADVFDNNFPVSAIGDTTLTGCQFDITSVENSATDPSDLTGNTVYVVWADNRNGTAAATNMNVFLSRSTDGGATWTVYPVDTRPNDQFYPWVSVAPNGRVDVGYMDRSYSVGQTVCQYGFTLTRLTFDGAGLVNSMIRTRVDTGLSDPNHSAWFSLANGNSFFVGDYTGVATGSDGATWSLWTDERNIIPTLQFPRNHGQHAVGARTP